jgi:hypothetical protein
VGQVLVALRDHPNVPPAVIQALEGATADLERGMCTGADVYRMLVAQLDPTPTPTPTADPDADAAAAPIASRLRYGNMQRPCERLLRVAA